MRNLIIILTLSTALVVALGVALFGRSVVGVNVADSAVDAGLTNATPAGGQNGLLQGDVDCDGDVDAVDALKDLQHVAAIGFSQTEPCPDVGTAIPQGVTGLVLVSGSSDNNSADVKAANALCPEGKRVIGGGLTIFGQHLYNVAITSSSPHSDLGGWGGFANEVNPTGNNWSLEAQAVCADVAD